MENLLVGCDNKIKLCDFGSTTVRALTPATMKFDEVRTVGWLLGGLVWLVR